MKTLKQVISSITEDTSQIDYMINDHLKQYHLHNIAWMAIAKLGDMDQAHEHMRKGMDHHNNAHALYSHSDGVGDEPFSERRKRIKAEVHAGIKDDLV